jgi:hypothetical protein
MQPITRQPRVFLKHIGTQEGFGMIPSRELYNVVGGDYEIGSTVTRESMEQKGFKVVIL